VIASLEDARVASEKVQRTARELSRFSRVGDPAPTALEVHDVLELAIDMAYAEIRHRARLVKDLSTVPMVEADEARLAQVFMILMVELAAALPEGQSEDHEIRLRTGTSAAGGAFVEVRRTTLVDGTPFPEGHVGAGGLQLCRALLTELGGTLVEERSGRSVAYRMDIPARAETTDGGSAARPTGPRRGRVLVVDDEPMVLASLKRALGRDHEVVACSDPLAAIDDVMNGGHFDVILCDVIMPVMTGMELHRRLSAISEAVAGRIVFVTGAAFSPSVRRFLDEVPNLRIGKPFDLQQIRAIVKSYVE
jgi:CheY-like chemotaxis protein